MHNSLTLQSGSPAMQGERGQGRRGQETGDRGEPSVGPGSSPGHLRLKQGPQRPASPSEHQLH